MVDKTVGTCRKCGEPVTANKWDVRECRNGCDQFSAAPTGGQFLSLSQSSYKDGVDGGGSMHYRAGSAGGSEA